MGQSAYGGGAYNGYGAGVVEFVHVKDGSCVWDRAYGASTGKRIEEAGWCSGWEMGG